MREKKGKKRLFPEDEGCAEFTGRKKKEAKCHKTCSCHRYVPRHGTFVTRLAGEVAIWSCANRTAAVAAAVETGEASAPCKFQRLPAPRFWWFWCPLCPDPPIDRKSYARCSRKGGGVGGSFSLCCMCLAAARSALAGSSSELPSLGQLCASQN